MQSKHFLECSLTEDICILMDSIYKRKYWTSFNYTFTLSKIREIENKANQLYIEKSCNSLQETCRQILDNSFVGDINLFITYFNVILYMKLLQNNVLWHQQYGEFPKDDKNVKFYYKGV